MHTRFQPGDTVALTASPERQGAVIAVLPPVAGTHRYQVFHGPGDVREYAEEQLTAFQNIPSTNVWAQVLISDQALDLELFRARLTAARLAHPLIDTLYALQAARITFIPFQFKPLLRLVRSDQPRLLIADEVGVGKTIEAGLILKELLSRQRLENVLIVCPKALVQKWRVEMRRFDEEFRVLDGRNLRYCLNEAAADLAWPSEYSRAIAHLELLRIDEYLGGDDGPRPTPGLKTLPPEVRFDLIIVDEAHHLRNPGTNSHELARFLCSASEAVLFLTATPVHIGATNLHSLLALLRPDLFPDEEAFLETIEPNPFIFSAMRHIRASYGVPDWQMRAADDLERAASTRWGRQVLAQDPRFVDLLRQLQSVDVLSDAQRVRGLRDLEELHSLAHVVNRTRRRDISQVFTQREPVTVTVPFTEAQQDFYRALIDFRTRVLLLRYDRRVVRLLLDTLERQAASCLPALAATLESLLQTHLLRLSDLAEGTDEDEEFRLPDELLAQAHGLLLRARSLPPEDPKRDALDELVRETLERDGPGKLLVFSFFLHTLYYLLSHLRAAGIRVELITGQVADEDRERLRDRFRLPRAHPDAIDVLLSSEVGCEGLDYEFCDRLVNYDIPWNPMRIEQRIGRIDRFGQLRPKVQIFNFVTPGTVEERIFFRCFDRLNVFRETLGDLEAVLGDVVQELSDIALRPDLTPEQAEERARQLTDNLVRVTEEQQRLEQESGALIGLDAAFASDVGGVVQDGRFVDSRDLFHLIVSFLGRPEMGGRLSPSDPNAAEHRLRLSRTGRAALAEQVRQIRRDHDDRASRTFQQWLDSSEQELPLTFQQQRAVAQRTLTFITPMHVLARAAVGALGVDVSPLVTRAAVVSSAVPAGRYLFGCWMWDSKSVRPELRLHVEVYSIERGEPAPDVAAGLLALLRDASSAEGPPTSPVEIDTGLRAIEDSAERERRAELELLLERNEALVSRRLASLEASYRNRSARVEAELSVATDERIKRMKRGEFARITDTYQRQRVTIEGRQTADIYATRIAAGILEVRHA